MASDSEELQISPTMADNMVIVKEETLATNTSSTLIHRPLIYMNSATQLPLRLTPSNYACWRAQCSSLFQGYNLMGYISGSFPCPQETITDENGVVVPNPDHAHWVQQDQLVYHAILLSMSTEPLMSCIASSKTSREAWETLSELYEERCRSVVGRLKDKLCRRARRSRTISKLVRTLKKVALLLEPYLKMRIDFYFLRVSN